MLEVCPSAETHAMNLDPMNFSTTTHCLAMAVPVHFGQTVVLTTTLLLREMNVVAFLLSATNLTSDLIMRNSDQDSEICLL